MTVSLLI